MGWRLHGEWGLRVHNAGVHRFADGSFRFTDSNPNDDADDYAGSKLYALARDSGRPRFCPRLICKLWMRCVLKLEVLPVASVALLCDRRWRDEALTHGNL